jgi:uncharacterized repeat protein (TIGR01451 family)
VVVKGGPDANLYDYLADHAPGADRDTFLHSPVNPNNGKHYGLSHISFCVAEAGAEIEIEETAVDDKITVGDRAAYGITVTSLGPAAAKDVEIDDELPNGALNWEIVSEDPDRDPDACAISGGNTLFCDVGDLVKDATFTVNVQTTEVIALGSDLCGTTPNNTAFANGSNVDQVHDSAPIDVECGSLLVHKVDDDNELLGGASFEVSSTVLDAPIAMTEEPAGVFCVGGLRLNELYTVTEAPPANYDGEDPKTFTPTADSSCADRLPGGTPDLTFENEQLHKMIVIVCHQADGTLAASDVTNGDASLTTLSAGSDLEAQLCALNGLGDKPHGNKSLTVNVGSDAHTP